MGGGSSSYHKEKSERAIEAASTGKVRASTETHTRLIITSSKSAPTDQTAYDVSCISGGWGTVNKVLTEERKGYINLDTGRQMYSEATLSKKIHKDDTLRCVSDNEEAIKVIRLIAASHDTGKLQIPSSPKKRPAIPDRIRDAVWMKYCGNVITSACVVCSGHISYTKSGWECGHIHAWAKGGPDVEDNMRPICSHCNKKMGDNNMITYIQSQGYPLHHSLIGVPVIDK